MIWGVAPRFACLHSFRTTNAGRPKLVARLPRQPCYCTCGSKIKWVPACSLGPAVCGVRMQGAVEPQALASELADASHAYHSGVQTSLTQLHSRQGAGGHTPVGQPGGLALQHTGSMATQPFVVSRRPNSARMAQHGGLGQGEPGGAAAALIPPQAPALGQPMRPPGGRTPFGPPPPVPGHPPTLPVQPPLTPGQLPFPPSQLPLPHNQFPLPPGQPPQPPSYFPLPPGQLPRPPRQFLPLPGQLPPPPPPPQRPHQPQGAGAPLLGAQNQHPHVPLYRHPSSRAKQDAAAETGMSSVQAFLPPPSTNQSATALSAIEPCRAPQDDTPRAGSNQRTHSAGSLQTGV